MSLKKYLIPRNYYNFIKKIERRVVVRALLHKSFPAICLENIWVNEIVKSEGQLRNLSNYKIFDVNIDLEKPIEWHKDYVSGFNYPLLRFDKLSIDTWFDSGIDVKFPWELSRCYFMVAWGQNYQLSGEKQYYQKFKTSLLDWINKNPFCYGVNWVSTMEISIRATNWIIACSLFWEEFIMDIDFQRLISISIQKHALYIDSFTENINNNHDISNYAGLFFISQFLKAHPRHKDWETKALNGLEINMNKQVFDDGVSYEYSTAYHRLVLEFFSFSLILGKLHHINFSNSYKHKLFTMFEFAGTYMDENGQSPQVNDNDSGRFIVLNESSDNDHTYLLTLGETIFDHSFYSQCKRRVNELKCWIPKFDQEKDLPSVLRDTSKSIGFDVSGFYFLKNKNLNIMVNVNNITRDSITSHKHFDVGSFVISYKGKQIVIDPGTYTYTRSLKKRNYFRGIELHNTTYFENSIVEEYYHTESFFGKYLLFPLVNLLEFSPNNIRFQIIYNEVEKIERLIILSGDTVEILDSGNGKLCSNLQITQPLSFENYICRGEDFSIVYNCESVISMKSDYSESYDKINHNGSRLLFKGNNELKLFFTFQEKE